MSVGHFRSRIDSGGPHTASTNRQSARELLIKTNGFILFQKTV